MSNKFQTELDNRLLRFNQSRPQDKGLPNSQKLDLIKAEIIYGGLYPSLKIGISGDVINDVIALCIYIEAINRGFSPIQAYDETEKQMIERKNNK